MSDTAHCCSLQNPILGPKTAFSHDIPLSHNIAYSRSEENVRFEGKKIILAMTVLKLHSFGTYCLMSRLLGHVGHKYSTIDSASICQQVTFITCIQQRMCIKFRSVFYWSPCSKIFSISVLCSYCCTGRQIIWQMCHGAETCQETPRGSK
jgi:hypothetical protein